jgi:hypothetical protein
MAAKADFAGKGEDAAPGAAAALAREGVTAAAATRALRVKFISARQAWSKRDVSLTLPSPGRIILLF